MGSNRELYLGQCQTEGHFISVVSCLTLCALFHTSSFIQRHCIGTDIRWGKGEGDGLCLILPNQNRHSKVASDFTGSRGLIGGYFQDLDAYDGTRPV